MAARQGYNHVVEFLIKEGADISIKDENEVSLHDLSNS